jgi:transposase
VGTKWHLLADARGTVVAAALSAGQAHESRFVTTLLDQVVPRPRRRRPRALTGDRGYSFPTVRAALRRRHIQAHIPERVDQIARRGRPLPLDARQYRRRNIIERVVGWLKEARRLATRYEKLAVHYLGFLHLGILRGLMRRGLPNTP